MGARHHCSCTHNRKGRGPLPQPAAGLADTAVMPRKRLVLVLVEVDAVRWEAAAFVRGVSLERFVREAVDHRIGCHASISVPGSPGRRD